MGHHYLNNDIKTVMLDFGGMIGNSNYHYLASQSLSSPSLDKVDFSLKRPILLVITEFDVLIAFFSAL